MSQVDESGRAIQAEAQQVQRPVSHMVTWRGERRSRVRQREEWADQA